MSTALERFLRYVSVDTQSAYDSTTYPSTLKQKDLGKMLCEEMKEMGLSDVRMDEYGYVYASIPGNVQGAPTVGFLAHMDTSPDCSGKDVKPRIVKQYDGGDIILNKELGIVMRTAEFPQLLDYVGEDLIVTDGTTLLGADDKAGIAEILAMAERLLSDPSIRHGDIKIGFTPDEEVGGGTDHFDVKAFGADFAYTVDGEGLGAINFENFNASAATVTVHGVNVHPGYAKDKMKNAILIAMEFQSMLPVFENPACTEGYEGFSHLNSISGSVEQTTLHYIIRDHDTAKIQERKQRFEKIAAYLNDRYGDGTIKLALTDNYYNMKEVVLPHYRIIEAADQATQEQGITPSHPPIRGGTDGVRLSFMGLPCPNLGAGGHNAHGKFEYLPVRFLEDSTAILVRLAEILAK